MESAKYRLKEQFSLLFGRGCAEEVPKSVLCFLAERDDRTKITLLLKLVSNLLSRLAAGFGDTFEHQLLPHICLFTLVFRRQLHNEEVKNVHKLVRVHRDHRPKHVCYDLLDDSLTVFARAILDICQSVRNEIERHILTRVMRGIVNRIKVRRLQTS